MMLTSMVPKHLRMTYTLENFSPRLLLVHSQFGELVKRGSTVHQKHPKISLACHFQVHNRKNLHNKNKNFGSK